MRTSTLVNATAEVVTITTLQTGDVYKRLEVNAYNTGDGKYQLLFGIVQDVLHNGTDAVISALEFTTSYTGVEPKLRTFGTDADLKLFAAQPDEVRQHFTEVQEASAKALQTARDAWNKAQATDAAVRAAIERSGAQVLTAAATARTQLEPATPDVETIDGETGLRHDPAPSSDEPPF